MAMMEAGRQVLFLKRASASRPSGQWSDDDFDVLCDGEVVGRIFKANAASVGASWMWTLAFGHHEDRTQLTGMPQRARLGWQRSRRAGGGSRPALPLARPLLRSVSFPQAEFVH
jgi:hypothetical protein